MKNRWLWLSVLVAGGPLLSGCGLYVPEKDIFHKDEVYDFPRPDGSIEHRTSEGIVEANIIGHIRCELTKGLLEAIATKNVPWLAGWGTAVSLNLTWDEQSNLSPSLIYTTPISGIELFTLASGASTSAHATRQENITFTLDNKELLRDALLSRPTTGDDCSFYDRGVTVDSDLKIDQFIFDKATIAGTHPVRTQSVDVPQFSVFQETITFVLSFSGGATPTWKLTRFTVNPNSNFVGASRTKTSVIIITMGKLAKPLAPAGTAELALQAQVQHEAAFAGASTASAIISQTR